MKEHIILKTIQWEIVHSLTANDEHSLQNDSPKDSKEETEQHNTG